MRDIDTSDDEFLVSKIASRVFKPNRCGRSASPELTQNYIAKARKISGLGHAKAQTLETLLREKQADEITCLESFALFLDYLTHHPRLSS